MIEMLKTTQAQAAVLIVAVLLLVGLEALRALWRGRWPWQ